MEKDIGFIMKLKAAANGHYNGMIADKDRSELNKTIETLRKLKDTYEDIVKVVKEPALKNAINSGIFETKLKLHALETLKENSKLERFANAATKSQSFESFVRATIEILGNGEQASALAQWYVETPVR